VRHSKGQEQIKLHAQSIQNRKHPDFLSLKA
jgi:hypothetical protein